MPFGVERQRLRRRRILISDEHNVVAMSAACFRQTIYLPVPGLVPTEELTPGDLVGTNKDSYLILEKLPAEYDNRVKAMEVDEKPTEEYSDIGGELACVALPLLPSCCPHRTNTTAVS